MATDHPQRQAEIPQMAAPRSATYHQASSAYPHTGDARERHDELTMRRTLAPGAGDAHSPWRIRPGPPRHRRV
jgi:hypothetical protein